MELVRPRWTTVIALLFGLLMMTASSETTKTKENCTVEASVLNLKRLREIARATGSFSARSSYQYPHVYNPFSRNADCSNRKALQDKDNPPFGNDPRIVGGKMVKKPFLPWVAKIKAFARNVTNPKHCTGILIDYHWILTAAHCIVYDNGEMASVVFTRLGVYNEIKDKGKGRMAISRVGSYYIHPGYKTANYDIALVKVERFYGPLLWQTKPVCLPLKGEIKVGQANCFIAAWGWIDESKIRKPQTLRWIDLNINRVDKNAIWANMSSTIDRPSGNSIGDSGAPLMCVIDGLYTLMGIHVGNQTSAGSNVTVNMNVQSLNEWMHRIINIY